MDLFHIALLISTLLCSLVSGFLFAFAIVVMPGIKTFNDHDFLQAFKVMDHVIQNNQPVFMVVWIGSIGMLVFSVLLSLFRLDGFDQLLIWTATAAYLIGVQFPTITINVPLNNRLQKHDPDTMTAPELRITRTGFEARWLRWNTIRTLFATLTSGLLIILVFRL